MFRCKLSSIALLVIVGCKAPAPLSLSAANLPSSLSSSDLTLVYDIQSGGSRSATWYANRKTSYAEEKERYKTELSNAGFSISEKSVGILAEKMDSNGLRVSLAIVSGNARVISGPRQRLDIDSTAPGHTIRVNMFRE